ncbi:MAG: NYN domain-containing protein [Brevefilum sp.]|nr:NYN domain-containing protein [Brevefilum sp.]MDT8382062.1 NYN domain-containing protein [Brevefilum sp.]MDW7755361.1 NYN domain-containing protein [Brevefilum sp.]
MARTTQMQQESFEDIERRIAILIDGDNAQASLIEQILVEAGKYGSATIRRVYGDWTTPNMNSWKDTLNIHAFQPIQQFRYTVGKNATDSAMIIDAMDIMHSHQVDGFCLVSSDSDYTRLATRIRESGMLVVGIGEKKTPRAFVSACNVFIYTENIKSRRGTASSSKPRKTNHMSPQEKELVELVSQAMDMVGPDDDGWTRLSEVGTALRRIDPGFDPRSYGHRQLSQMIKNHGRWIEMRKAANGAIIEIRLRD